MHSLIIETVALKPHLETAGEVALVLKQKDEQVSFAWLGDNLPWSDWALPIIAHIAGCSLKPRIAAFQRMMDERGVQVLSNPKVDALTIKHIRDWAFTFTGDINALKSYTFDGALLGMGAASSLISWYRDSLYDPRNNVQQTRNCLFSAGIVYARALQLLEKEKPDQLITFNGRFVTSKPLFEAAKKLGIPTLRHERGATSDRYEVFDDAVHNYAYIGQRIVKAASLADPLELEKHGHAFYQRRRGGDGIYWYSFTEKMQKGLVPPRIEGKRRVVYFSSSDDEYAAVTDVYTPGPWPDQLSAVRDLIAACDTLPDVELIIRVHPNMAVKSAAEQARWMTLAGKNLCIIAPQAPVDSYALCDSADVVVSYGSTIGMEAAYWGKPTLLIGPGTYAGHGIAHEPKNREEILRMLSASEPLTVAPKERCLPYGYYYLTFGTKFKYYQPTSLSEGTFLGERLGWDPDWVYWLRKQGVGKMLNKVMRRK